ncbi:exosortase B [Methylophilus aquaticus]|uniref:Exosortase B n=1 Tax=Methylophilus aquaticus TaxID=1971610 RepID=A0ABT9JT72_9PROT|nr:exosortase B [Methylophilus aquaticus]MDP8567778.1 exosortase B [Methylophilus aquaticus]
MVINFNAVRPYLINWWPLLLGFAALVLPTYANLFTNIWNEADQAHGPLVLMVVLYLFYDKRQAFSQPSSPAPRVGWVIFALSLLIYILGRSQDILMLDMGAQTLLIVALILQFKGWTTLKAVWFPLFFMVFMIPLPGFFVDAVTMPMKIAVSQVAEHVLYWFDYPIARNGVILQIGQYQLLVADACAGMHTLISLEALGLLYLNLVKHDSLARNVTLALFIVPISFTANTIRVIAITLVTYYFGDAVGQGFVHGFAGMVLFLVALLLIIFIDSTIQRLVKLNNAKG